MQMQVSLMRGQVGNNECYCVGFSVRTMPLPPSLCDKQKRFIIIIMKYITQRRMLNETNGLSDTLQEKIPHALPSLSLCREFHGQCSPPTRAPMNYLEPFIHPNDFPK